MPLLNTNVLSVLTQYIDDREAPVLCDLMDYDTSNYKIKNIVDITTYKPSDGTISKVYWDPLLNRLPHTFHVVCRLDNLFESGDGICHEVQLDRNAKVYSNKVEYRNKDGNLHRIGGPAVTFNNGHKYWYKNGILHHIGGPAVELGNGDKLWYQNGNLHRIGGPAIEHVNSINNKWYEFGIMIIK